MTTLIEVLPDVDRVRVRTTGGLLRPQVRRTSATSAQVALVATGATLLGGDRIDLRIVVGAGVRLELTDIAGTVAYDGRGTACAWDTTIELAEGADLLWHGEPLVVADGAEVHRSLDVALAPRARLLLRDTLALGRTGEDGGTLRCRTRMTVDERPAVVEALDLDPSRRTWPGVLGEAKVLDTITALGWTPDPGIHDAGVMRFFDLHRPGRVARALVPRAHLSTAPSVWASWRAALLEPADGAPAD